jgi:two-component system, LytTR family, sensor kinase
LINKNSHSLFSLERVNKKESTLWRISEYAMKEKTSQNLMFWMVLALIFTLINQRQINFFEEFWFEIINVSFYALIVYVNKYYLFPKYIKNNKFGLHLIFLLLASVILAPIKSFFLYTATSDEFMRSYTVNNQLFVFLSTFIVGAGSSIYLVLQDWVKSQNAKQELKNETLQSELKFLKSQINPHFLFNTLNSLYALTLKKSDLAPEIVLRLSEMMRYMLYECNEKKVMLEKEINYLVNYLELEKLRHGTKMQVKLQVKGEPGHKMIAPLMFIPFIENSFKHGISQHTAESFVNLDVEIVGDRLSLYIENSKAPVMPGSRLKKSGGIGLANVKRRLDLLYPNAHQLEVFDNPDSYAIKLIIQLSEMQ